MQHEKNVDNTIIVRMRRVNTGIENMQSNFRIYNCTLYISDIVLCMHLLQ